MMSKKFGKPIVDRGMVLAVKLYKTEGINLSPAKLVATLKERPYAPKKKSDITAGFADVKAKVKTVRAEFVAGFNVPYLKYDPDGGLTPDYQLSVDKGVAFIKLDKNTLEVRGSGRLASRFKGVLEELTGCVLEPLNLNGGTKKLYDRATTVTSVALSELKKEASTLRQVQFAGDDIKREDEIGLYTRKFDGKINRFRASFKFPSGEYKTVINADVGSLLLYRGGEGPYEKDLAWIVALMEDSAPGVKKAA
jgi:hypothetical protein